MTFQSFAAIVIALLFTNSLQSQTYIVERWAFLGEDRFGEILLRGGSFDGNHYARKMSAEIELNAEDRTVIFRRVTFEIPIKGKNFASGFGESVFIEGKIIAQFTDDNPLPLTPGVGTEFYVSRDDWDISIPNENVSVTYEFWGPTERVEGTFIWDTNRWQLTRRNSPIIDTIDYPNEVSAYIVGTVGRGPRWHLRWRSPTIKGNIDGADISFHVGSSYLRFPESLKFTLKPDPRVITDISILANGSILIDGLGTIGVSDSAAGPFSGEIDLPAIIHPDGLAKFYKAN